MQKTRSWRAAALALCVLTFGALSACSTNPYQKPAGQASPARGELKLPTDADLTQMDRQYELSSRGLYLQADGSVRPLPPPVPVAVTQSTVPTQEQPKAPAVKAVPKRAARRVVKRTSATSEAMVFDAVPKAIDITAGAGK